MTDKTDLITIDKFSEIEKLYFIRINNFYKNLSNCDMQHVYDIITKNKSKISLRFLDWFVTKYCKMYNTIIKVNNKYTSNKPQLQYYNSHDSNIDTYSTKQIAIKNRNEIRHDNTNQKHNSCWRV